MFEPNSIPEPLPDVQSLVAAVRALKEVVEGLTGQRPGAIASAPRLFVQPLRPDPTRVLLRTNDLWIAEGTSRMYYYDGRLWQQVVT